MLVKYIVFTPENTMNASDYHDWLERAFIYVEAALATELARPSHACMSEDYLRVSLIRGLAYTKPELAHRVDSEFDAPWTGNPCWYDPTHDMSKGRAMQHDVAVVPDAIDQGMICEVKWLKQSKGKELAKDIWKLALSRTTSAEGNARRTFLLVGGVGKSMSDTFATIRKNKMNIRWSNAGRTSGNPKPREISLEKFYRTKLGADALHSTLSRGNHFRRPPECWRQLRLTIRQKWYRTLSTVKWRMCLFEFDHRAVSTTQKMLWATAKSNMKWKCKPKTT